MDNHKRIHICMLANSLEVNGVSTVIMNYCRNIDLKRFDISIIVGVPVADIYRKECSGLNIQIYELPSRKTAKKNYYKALYRLLKKKHFDIFHIHGGSSLIVMELVIAKLCGIKVRIAHSHNTTCLHLKTHNLLLPFFKHLYTHAFACGKEAGKWLFDTQKFYIIPNGFCMEKFKYSEIDRDTQRKRLGLEGKYVLGHIGRFNEQKNHKFLLEIFAKVAQQNKEAVLLLIGTGPSYDSVMKLIQQHPFKNRIITHGETNHPEIMYNAMDILVFPSLFEGLPIVLLEAQVSGLPCLISDVITKEADLSSTVTRLSLNDSSSHWAEAVLDIGRVDREHFFDIYQEGIKRYNIKDNVHILENLYMECCEKYN